MAAGVEQAGRAEKKAEFVGEIDPGGNGHAVALGGLELELAGGCKRGFVEALPGRRRDLGVEHVPLGVQAQFQPHVTLLPTGQGRGRIDRLGLGS